jgi:hypothetical protein
MAASDAMLLGTVTYEEFAAFWPYRNSAGQPFTDYLNNTLKYVVSQGEAPLGGRERSEDAGACRLQDVRHRCHLPAGTQLKPGHTPDLLFTEVHGSR